MSLMSSTSSSNIKYTYMGTGSSEFSPEFSRFQDKIRRLEEDLDSERDLRNRIERDRVDLSMQLVDLSDRLDEAEGGGAAQLDLQRKRDNELSKLRKLLDDAHLDSEESSTAMRSKHQAQLNDFNDQVDHLQKQKNKVEKEKQRMNAELIEVSAQCDHFRNEKESSDKHGRDLEKELQKMQDRLDDATKQLNESNNQKTKLSAENLDLQDRLRDSGKQMEQLQFVKMEIQKQLEEAKRHLDEEIKIKITIQTQLRNTELALADTRAQLEEELDRRSDLERQLAKAKGEADNWKSKYDAEVQARIDLEEEFRKKMAMKQAEYQEQLDILMGKVSNLEKAKSKLQQELNIVLMDLDKANITIVTLENKLIALEKLCAELRAQNDALAADLEAARKDAQNARNELNKLKTNYAALEEKHNALMRDHKKIEMELHDAKERLQTASRTIHELEITIKRLEQDNHNLAEAYKDAERRAKEEEAKARAAIAELQQVRADLEKKLQMKHEEMEAMRKGMQMEIDILIARVNDAESKLKSEVARLKKKYQAEIHELEMSLDHANHLNMEHQKTIKRLASELKDVTALYDDAQRQLQHALDQVNALTRKVSSLQGEIEDIKGQLDQAVRARKNAEREAEERSIKINELTQINISLSNTNKKMENDIHALRGALDDARGEARLASDRAVKAAADAAKAIDDLHSEQERCAKLDSHRKSLEVQLKEMQIRIQEVEANAMASAKRMVVKLEVRIRELEVEIDEEKKRHTITLKNLRSKDRQVKDIALQLEEESSKAMMFMEANDKLTQKVTHYKRIVDDTEGHTAGAMAKVRRVERELEDAEGRADFAETNLSMLRAKHHTCVSTGRLQPAKVSVTVEEQRVHQRR